MQLRATLLVFYIQKTWLPVPALGLPVSWDKSLHFSGFLQVKWD